MIEIIKHGVVPVEHEQKETHTCKKCGCVYSYVVGKDKCNDYSDYEDDDHYDCPECGTPYYRSSGINFLGCMIRNIFC